MENARRALMDDVASLRKTLDEKDNGIQRYDSINPMFLQVVVFLARLREESERIRFNCEQDIQNTRLQVKEIIVR